MRTLVLALLIACKTPKDTGKPASETGKGGSHDSEVPHETSDSHAAEVVPGPSMPHEAPTGGAMCFDCHLCANEGASALEVTHWVCVDCHKGPDGSVPDEVQSGCGCGGLDCSTDPPTLGCADCHIEDGSNGYPTSGDMNEHCSICHEQGEIPAKPSPHGGRAKLGP